ncbi:MAG: hypothetical protein R3F24_06495 [Gammaproteobacteria bacterium]
MTELPAHWQDKIANAVVTFGDQSLMGMDPPPGGGHKPQGFMVSLELDSPAETERVYLGLREGGQITMPLNETFWSLSFAMLTDRFGTPWMLTCPRPGFKHPG